MSWVFGQRSAITGRYLGNPDYGKGQYARWLEELAACRLDPGLVILQTVRRKGWDIGQADAYLLEWEWTHGQRAWVWGAETRIRVLTRHSVPSADALPTLVGRPRAARPTRPLSR